MLISISHHSYSLSAPGSRKGEVGHIQGFQCVLMPPGDGDIFQILGSGDLSGRRQFSGGIQKPGKDAGGVAEADKDSQRGGGAAGVRIFL